MNPAPHASAGRKVDWLERLAVTASAVCLLHCIALPLLFAALPTLALLFAIPKSFHVWALALAVPTSATALLLGFRDHRSRLPLIVGCTGLGLLAIGALVLLEGRLETPVTIAGGMMLAAAHILNWRRRHGRHSHG